MASSCGSCTGSHHNINRRRQGEVSKMTVEDFSDKCKVDLSSDALEELSSMERSLCKIFTRVEIKGKRERTVPVLLTHKMLKAIHLLLQFGSEGGIRLTNSYFFAYSFWDNFLRGCEVLRHASMQCGAKHPERLRATKLRKHVAPLCQVLNMDEHEIEMVAQFMGHSISVHRDYYRLPDNILQTAKIAKIFCLMDSGNLATQFSKSLDELVIEVKDDNIFVDNDVGEVVVEDSDMSDEELNSQVSHNGRLL